MLSSAMPRINMLCLPRFSKLPNRISLVMPLTITSQKSFSLAIFKFSDHTKNPCIASGVFNIALDIDRLMMRGDDNEMLY